MALPPELAAEENEMFGWYQDEVGVGLEARAFSDVAAGTKLQIGAWPDYHGARAAASAVGGFNIGKPAIKGFISRHTAPTMPVIKELVNRPLSGKG